MSDALKTDLAVRYLDDGAVDLDLSAGDLARVEGLDNLRQALQLRLLSDEGALTELGHPRWGSRLSELIGRPADRANVELLRRYTRRALMAEGRVKDVLSVQATARADLPGVVEIVATVEAVTGETLTVGAAVDLN